MLFVVYSVLRCVHGRTPTLLFLFDKAVTFHCTDGVLWPPVQLGHLREDNNKQAMELARLRQEIADRDESLARMEAMHARLLQANRDYAADQIQFRESMAREFEAAAAVKDDALKRADVAREKVRDLADLNFVLLVSPVSTSCSWFFLF